MILGALQFGIFSFKLDSPSSKILKIPEFNLGIKSTPSRDPNQFYDFLKFWIFLIFTGSKYHFYSVSWSPRASMKSASNPSKSSISSSSWVNFESVANALDWPKISFQAFKKIAFENYRLIQMTCNPLSKLHWISFFCLKIRLKIFDLILVQKYQ